MTRLAKSPLRYPGGKSRAVDQILQHVPGRIDEYREPFVGGGSAFFALRSLFGSRLRYWLNDLNDDLMHFWTTLQRQPDDLIGSLQVMKQHYPVGTDLYQFLKEDANARTPFERAVRFFIMNRITFSGVMDAGGYSQQAFEARFTPSSIERVEKIAPLLQNVTLTNGDYMPLLTTPGDNVFIFLDPPYWNATHSKLYGKKGVLHTGFDHERFAEQMRLCKHRWLITYDDSPYIRSLYGFANLIEWELQYGMNNYKSATAAKGRELFIRNY